MVKKKTERITKIRKKAKVKKAIGKMTKAVTVHRDVLEHFRRALIEASSKAVQFGEKLLQTAAKIPGLPPLDVPGAEPMTIHELRRINAVKAKETDDGKDEKRSGKDRRSGNPRRGATERRVGPSEFHYSVDRRLGVGRRSSGERRSGERRNR